ncbi:MAG: hypothetical protein ABI766_08180 [Gemmatimonadales bacterium]
MRKTLLIAAALVLAGCGQKKAADTPGAEGGMAAPADTGMAGSMTHDSMSMHSDSTMTRDSAK